MGADRSIARRTAWTHAVSVCAATTLLAGCATQAAGPGVTTGSLASETQVAKAAPVRREEKVVKIALLLPFGAIGQTAALAKSMKQATELALFDRENLQFQVLPYDDKGTPEGARAAAEQAKAEGAELVLGPLFSGSVASAAGVTRPANIPLIAFSNDRQVAGRGVYLVTSIPDDEVRHILRHASAEGRKRVAALVPDDGYGAVVEAAMRQALAANGQMLVAFEKYPVTANGAVEPARRLVERLKEAAENGAPADALLLPGGHETLINLAPLLTYSGLEPGKIMVLGLSGMDGGNLGRDPLMRGARFAGADPRGWQDFAGRFSRAFGSTPPRVAAVAFDAMTIAATLAAEPAEVRYSPKSLVRPSGFQGIDGTVTFNDQGLAQRSLAILELTEQHSVVVEAAPQSPSGAAIARPTLPAATTTSGVLPPAREPKLN